MILNGKKLMLFRLYPSKYIIYYNITCVEQKKKKKRGKYA